MFKKLLSDKTINSLKKVPVFVWYLIFGVVSFFSSLYSNLEVGPDTISYFNEMMQGTVNTTRMLYLIYPLLILTDILIFEFIAYIAYSIFSRRFFLQISQKDFVFRLRLFVILANFFIGLISLIYFAFPQLMIIGTAILNMLITGVFLGFFLYEICRRYLPGIAAAKGYSYMAKIYLGINIIIAILNFIQYFVYEGSTSMEIIASAVQIIVIGLLMIFAYYQYKKLNDLPKDTPKEKIIIEEKKDETVFKDFGF